MAAKRRRRIMQNISSVPKTQMGKRNSNRRFFSGIDLSNISSKAAEKNRNSSQRVKDSMKKKLSQDVPSTFHSSFYNSSESKQEMNKREFEQANSPLEKGRRRSSRITQTKLISKIKEISSRVSSYSASSIVTRSHKKLVDSRDQLLRKSKAQVIDVCSLNPVTYLSKVSKRKVSTSSGTMSFLEETVKGGRMQRNSDGNSELQKKKYHFRSKSEKMPRPLKLAVSSRKRVVSLPIDDLVCTTLKSATKKKEMCVLKPISDIAMKKSSVANTENKGKISKNSLNEKESKVSTSKQTSSVKSLGKSTKRKHDGNSDSVENSSYQIFTRRTTRSSLLGKSIDIHISLPSKKVVKKYKRHTFPMLPCVNGLKNSIPSKGTLKRKRWIFNTLKERNDGYEDDIFETRKFDNMNAALKISDDESDSTDASIATPKCGFFLTPSLPKKTPLYKECISSTELLAARKVAEEYLFRRNKKWKSNDKVDSDQQSSESKKDLPEKKKLDYGEVLQNVIKAQKDIEKLTQDGEEDEDAYFSDISV